MCIIIDGHKMTERELRQFDRLRPHAADVLAVIEAMATYSALPGRYGKCAYCKEGRDYTPMSVGKVCHKPTCPVLTARRLMEVLKNG